MRLLNETTHRRLLASAGVVLSLCTGVPLLAQPVGSAFTYQGRLGDAGGPATGAYDFQFTLYDSAAGGSQVGPIVVRDDVIVTDGLFTVTLDFGTVFAGNKRWLQVAVRPGASTGPYTALAPRQELTPGPSALWSAAAPWTGIGGKPAGFADDIDNDVLGGLSCANGQVAKWNGSIWACAADGDHDHLGQAWTGASLTGLSVESTAVAGTGLQGRAGGAGPFSWGVVGESSSSSGIGVFGRTTSLSGAAVGVVGQSDSSQGTGVSGSGGGFGVRGQSTSINGSAVFGTQTASTGVTYGVKGWTASSTGRGVSGAALSTVGGIGVEGLSDSSAGTGVFGWVTATSGGTTAVLGRTDSTAGRGVFGQSFATGGTPVGVAGETLSSGGRGVHGRALALAGATFGVWGSAQSSAGTGVYGEATFGSGPAYGVHGVSSSLMGRGVFGAATAASPSASGVYGEASVGYGVYGSSSGTTGIGVLGIAAATAGTNYGVFGTTGSTAGFAGWFTGRVHVNGTLTKNAGAFKIDHPLDPEHKYLYHAFVESPDMKNVYDGVVTTDGEGFATVTLPDWFEALNRDFRYQLTVLGDGAWARARVYREVAANRFVVQTDLPATRVSWQVTGIRKDPYAEKYRVPLEEDKPDDERGSYLNPEAWSTPLERGLDPSHRVVRHNAP